MNIKEFISNFKNHPVLFVGTGVSLRYLSNSYTWDGLLKKIAFDLKGNSEYYLDLKSTCQEDGVYNFEKLASLLENEFNETLINDRNGKFQEINDVFYENMENGQNLSRFKIYISKIFSELEIREDKNPEIAEFKKARKNIGSIITTNYDNLIEHIFEFDKLIGNNILLSNPYGSIYKIHGCTTEPHKIIITENDYSQFDGKYELIRAQLLSLFIHHPIIFIGYGVGDNNIKKILKTIFTYVEPNSDLAKNIRNNFLLVEYEKDADNEVISEHDIDMDGYSTVRINKIKTDNFTLIYQALANIHLPISAMDVRKVQNVVAEIYAGGKIEVKITEDLDSLKNGDKILAIGSSKTISYQYQTASEIMTNYFKIMEESNHQILVLIDKYKLQSAQYFPIFGFSSINGEIKVADKLKAQQITNIKNALKSTSDNQKKKHNTIQAIMDDMSIPLTYKIGCIIWNIFEDNLELNDVEKHLKGIKAKNDTNFRKLLCAYDLKKYE
ncbi:SIR2 family protein [Bizionia saleffrena]|uniref:SIR2 family protein n=1 Tax=Bizionia saleffrena TaxID=291189 RepID=A0A8H2LCU6_9FLAO|nr:SIR2 family protein [Bizionia saleffrena]TYB72166.1 SIR2 family protein [Bizionia saleffrena]